MSRLLTAERARMRASRPRPAPAWHKGHALLTVTALLGLLSLTATSFVTIATQERRTAQNHILQVRARMLAEAGIERAVSDLRSTATATDDLGSSPLQRRQAWSDPRDDYFYADLQAAPFGPRPYGSAPAPLAHARRISYAAALAPFDASCSISGQLGGTFGPASDTFALKVIDCAAQINVNDHNAALARILDQLGAVTGVERVGGLTLGAAIVGTRPRAGYASKDEVLARVFGGDADRFARIREFITCHGWVDPGTVRWSAAAPRWTPEPRAPINVNTAPKEVLVAVLWGLAARVETTDGAGRPAVLAVGPIARDRAEAIADQLIANRPVARTQSPFNDWPRFSREILGRLRGLSRLEMDLLRANFNPNSDLKKLNPDRLLADPAGDLAAGAADLLDKSDLTASSTEFCFGSMGYYEIEALGRVAQGGRTLAHATVVSVVKLFDVFRATSQRDFETDRVWSDRRFGDLRGPDGIPAVTSIPEYPYATGRTGYRSTAGDAAWAAEYDGSLLLSGVARTPVVNEADRTTFVAGFGRGRVEADLGRGTDRPDGPRAPLEAGPGAPAEARVSDRQVVQGRGGARAFTDGSDLDPFGLRLDGRGRLKSYPPDAWPTGAGTLELLVKPAADQRPGGAAAAAGGTGRRRMPLVSWSNGGSYNFVRFDLFTEAGRLFAVWSAAGDGSPYPTEAIRLFADLDWAAHTWHHVEVGWDSDGTWLFVDGQVAPGSPARAPVICPCPPDLTLTAPWFVVGGTVDLEWNARVAPAAALGGADQAQALDAAREHLVVRRTLRAGGAATIDNLVVHPMLRHRKSFLPPSRYQDPSYRAYTAAGNGPGGRRQPVGVYKRRLRALEDAAQAGDVTLGTVSCTALVPDHEHASGHAGAANAFGHVTPGVELVAGGASTYLSEYAVTTGQAVGRRIAPGTEVAFLAEFEVPDRLPVMESPVLCDFTVTWSGRPAFLLWTFAE